MRFTNSRKGSLGILRSIYLRGFLKPRRYMNPQFAVEKARYIFTPTIRALIKNNLKKANVWITPK